MTHLACSSVNKEVRGSPESFSESTGPKSLGLLSVWHILCHAGIQATLHYTTPLLTSSSSSFQSGLWLIWSLAWSLLLPFHWEPENLGSILILEGPADSCCTSWAESRPLSCGLWKLLQSLNCTSDVQCCYCLALTQHKLAQDHPKSPFTESTPLLLKLSMPAVCFTN